MTLILSDFNFHSAFLPLTFNKPVAELRFGMLTLREKWEKLSGQQTFVQSESYLANKFEFADEAKDKLVINATILPDKTLVEQILNLADQTVLLKDDSVIAYRSQNFLTSFEELNTVVYEDSVIQIRKPWHLFSMLRAAFDLDFELLTSGRMSQNYHPSNTVIGNHPVFIEKGAQVYASVLNTQEGPIYIGKNSQIMEGSMLRGPIGISENSAIKMGAKIYGPCCIGPHSKIGGEVKNVMFFGYSNKGHDGFLGDSVIGEWCNLGADTNTSNLKNNYARVKLWNYESERFEQTEEQFLGIIMGDHSKAAINTMFNTGTVVGFSCNVYGSGFPRNFIPSFSWGGNLGYTDFKVKKAIEVAQIVMDRRGIEFSEEDELLFEKIYTLEQKWKK
ncbi:MAG: glucose-1-phosphate thymidylyltransferase [Flavobacteriaceae bacterium]|nr:glucose-1-phosphate thymidylyltransferase [Flavobacteriaceae bacterium]